MRLVNRSYTQVKVEVSEGLERGSRQVLAGSQFAKYVPVGYFQLPVPSGYKTNLEVRHGTSVIRNHLFETKGRPGVGTGQHVPMTLMVNSHVPLASFPRKSNTGTSYVP